MFDISFSELAIIIIIGFLVLGPSEMLKMIKSAKKALSAMKEYYHQYINYLNKELGEADLDLAVVKIIYDENGSPQHSYEIDKIKPLLKKSAND